MRRRLIAAAALALGFSVAACGPGARNALRITPPASQADVARALVDCERAASGRQGVVNCIMVANSPYADPDQAYVGHLKICELSVVRRGREPSKSLKHCDNAIALKPDAADPHAAKAHALSRSGRLADALISADKAVALEAGHEDARIIRAFLRNALDDRPGALGDIRVYNEVVAAAGETRRAGAYALEAQILTGLDRLDEARDITDAGRADHPTSYLLDRADAWIEIKRDNAGAALAYAERALERRPGNQFSRVTRAVAYLQGGDLEGALTDFRIARKHDPKAEAGLVVALLEAVVVAGKVGLKQLGYDPGGDGPEIDPNARRAMAAFQKANGFGADGRYTTTSLDAVFKAAKIDRKGKEAPDDMMKRFLKDGGGEELQT